MFDNPTIKYIMVAVWGLALSALVFQRCNKKDDMCKRTIFKAPKGMTNSLVTFGNSKCYVVRHNIVPC